MVGMISTFETLEFIHSMLVEMTKMYVPNENR